jgi:prepilin-type processing-associated H-X9-DG protein
MNGYLGPHGMMCWWRSSVRVTPAAQTILFSESYYVPGFGDGCVENELEEYTMGLIIADWGKDGVHNGINNIAYCDGHVASWTGVTALCNPPYGNTGWPCPQSVWEAGYNPWAW